MRAVLIATGYRKELSPLLKLRPSPLLNVGDRPIIFHIVEYLATLGVKEFDLVLSYLPEIIEATLGDGKRWGISINYHLVKDADYPFGVLAPISRGWSEDHILLGQGDSVPYLNLNFLDIKKNESTEPLLFQYQDNTWSEWGIFPTKSIGNVPNKKLLADIPEEFPSKSLKITKPYISTRSFNDIIRSNQTFMRQGNLPHLFPTSARKVDQDVWISHAVTIHPTVKITPPIFIGENCQINSGVSLGPYTVIEKNCIIDKNSIVKDSLICQNSYVGETLDVNSCIVDRNMLINLEHGTQCEVREDFILSEIWPEKVHYFPFSIFEKIFAIFCLILLLPFFIPLWIKYGIKKEKMVFLPSPENEKGWKTFTLLSFKDTQRSYFKRMPHLLNIISGDIHFIGVSPRSRKEIKLMASDWRKLYLKSKAGIITIASVEKIPDDSLDEIYASEVFYASQMGFWNDTKLFLKWLYKKLNTNI